MKYTPETVALICELVAAGEHNVADVCAQANISQAIFFKWKAEKLEFLELLKKAETQRREALRLRAASGLAKLLDVYEVEETLTEFVDKDGKPTIKSKKTTKRVVMPNPAAIIYTLNNTDPDNWQQRKHVELSGGVTQAQHDLTQLSDAELDQYLSLQAKVQPLQLNPADAAAAA